MKVIILGATGFLGNDLVKNMALLDWEMVCVIRRQSNIDKLQSIDGKIRYQYIDDLNAETLKEEQFDAAYNLSCKYLGSSTTIEVIESNYVVGARFLSTCVEAGVPKFISIGTGLPDDFNLYCLTKKQLNELGKYYASEQTRLGKTFHFCNVELERFYGEGEPVNRFIPDTILKMLRGEDVLFTEGNQKRDFIYIQDVIYVLLKLPELDLPEYLDMPVGSGQGPSIREVMEYLHNITESKSELKFGAIEKRFHEPDSVADLTVLKSYGLSIKYSWEDGMKKVVEYYKTSF